MFFTQRANIRLYFPGLFERIVDDLSGRRAETGKDRPKVDGLDVGENFQAHFEHLEPPFDRGLIVGRDFCR